MKLRQRLQRPFHQLLNTFKSLSLLLFQVDLLSLFRVCIICNGNLYLFQLLMNSQWCLLNTNVDRFQKFWRKFRIRRTIHTLRKLSKLRKSHLIDHLRIMKITLQHHQQVGQTIYGIWVHQHSSLLVLLIISNTKRLYNSLDDLRFSGKSEVLEQYPQPLVNRDSCKFDLTDVLFTDFAGKFINITN